jgi:hypothetical protein
MNAWRRHRNIALLGLLVCGTLVLWGCGDDDRAVRFTADEVAKLTAPDAAAWDQFGYAVSVSGITAVVGAPWEDPGWPEAGAAYVFEFNPAGGAWEQADKLTASDAASDDYFGWSVSVSGSTLVVGAPWEDTGGSSAGAAYVFEFNPASGAWEEADKLTASDAGTGDGFGFSVSVSGTTVVVGAMGEGTGGTHAGAAYVFEMNPASGAWEEAAKLTASDAGPDDWFGWSVSVSGATALVGAPGEGTGGSSAGAAYVFEFNPAGGAWEETDKLTASDAEADDEFGLSVSVGGATAVVGSPGEDAGGDGAGAAYVFEFNPASGAWQEAAKLTASDAEAGDGFGGAVSVDGTTMVVGAPWEDTGGSSAGAGYVFVADPAGGAWQEAAKLTASDAGQDHFFGGAVSVGGTTAVLGADGEDTGGRLAGAAYVFEFSR